MSLIMKWGISLAFIFYVIFEVTFGGESNDQQCLVASRLDDLKNRISVMEKSLGCDKGSCNVTHNIADLERRVSLLEVILECTDGQCDVRKGIAELESRVASLELEKTDSRDDWQLLFSAKKGSSLNVYRSWNTPGPINPDNPKAEIFKSPLVDQIDTYRIPMDTVKLAVSVGDEEVAYWIFDGRGESSKTWMHKDKLLASSCGNLADQTFNYFSQVGHDEVDRHFFISKKYAGCPRDVGWLAVVDPGTKAVCTWMERSQKPFFLYCTGNTICNFNTANIADTFTIWTKLA